MTFQKCTARFFAVLTAILIAVSGLYHPAFFTYAEEDISAETILALMEEIPKYYNLYCTEESAAALDACLEQFSPEELPDYSAEALSALYDALCAGIGGLTYQTAEIPQIYITTGEACGETMTKETGYVSARIVIADTDGSVIDDNVQIKVRGNSTARVLKRSYTFKFSKKYDVLGMGKAKKWILLANCLDPTMLRNYTALEIAHELGLEYASEHRFTEIWVDGIFKGFYELTEPVQEGKTRVDIDVESNGGMKDFLIQYEQTMTDEGAVYFKAEGLRFELKSPEDVTEEQRDYVQSVMTEIIQALKRLDYAEIRTLIDTDSFAKLYLLNEFLKTVDFDYSSVFFYYKDGILYAGPPWDFDLSAGNESSSESEKYARAVETSGLFANQQLFSYLCQCEAFMLEVRELYAEHAAFFSQLYPEGGFLDTTVQTYAAAIERNRTKAKWYPGAGYFLARLPDETYEENLEYLRNWLRERDMWLSEYFEIYAAPSQRGDVDADGVVDVTDAVLLARYLSEDYTVRIPYAGLASADVDGSGSITLEDVLAILRMIVQLTE